MQAVNKTSIFLFAAQQLRAFSFADPAFQEGSACAHISSHQTQNIETMLFGSQSAMLSQH